MAEESISLDRALLGAHLSVDVPLPAIGRGVVVSVRALTPTELIEVGIRGADVDPRALGADRVVAGIRCRALALACTISGRPAFESPADVAQWVPAVTTPLWAAFAKVHGSAYLAVGEVQRAMAEQLQGDGVWIERLRAQHAAGIVAFYGLTRAVDATPAQVVWFAKLMQKEKR